MKHFIYILGIFMSASTALANELISEQNTSQPSINSALVQDHEGNIY